MALFPEEKIIKAFEVEDSISSIINENIESLENVNKPIRKSLENDISLLNHQITTVFNDLNNKSKEAESALNAIDALRYKTAEILSKPNNPELEIDFRRTCLEIKANSSLYDPPLMQAYQDYLKAYQQKTSLYNITVDQNSRINLHIYSTETETQEEAKNLQIPEPLDMTTCITQLPNGKLFCFGSNRLPGITVLIDVNGGVEVLPSGTHCYGSSCIYFSNSAYFFGGFNEGNLTLSSKFDMDWNRWKQLTPMPQADHSCNSIIFNGNILISGYKNRNLLLYSIDIDSFSTIPYKFEEHKVKILINAERLYLIECPGSIYESEIGSYSNWRQIGKSAIYHEPGQVYCSYNKGGIWISVISHSTREYYFFNLDQKVNIDAAYYNTHVSIRRVGKKIEAIKFNNQNFKLDPYYLDEYNAKDIALRALGENLEVIEELDEKIKRNPNKFKYYNDKGKAFYNLGRYIEAIECYDEAIKLNPNSADFHHTKGCALNELGKYPEAVKSYDEAIKINPEEAKFYKDKGNALYILEKYQEAMKCYDELIKLEPNNPLHFCNRARVFNNLRQEEAALQDFNRAYNFLQEFQLSEVYRGEEWTLSEKDINFINDELSRDRIELLQKMQN
ncbi:unnamed protein product [Blepharisma stoltei]|uniref:Tetratricopeptide repeat protein n=1 Tax=Blepharisma stoltei TaxID=1481888 RepID=A0AAU9JXJ2_9CILI|nr:unnamed protein product [Blepharisma stoltei]